MTELYDQDAEEAVDPIVLLEYYREGWLTSCAKLIGAMMVLVICIAVFTTLFISLVVSALKGA